MAEVMFTSAKSAIVKCLLFEVQELKVACKVYAHLMARTALTGNTSSVGGRHKSTYAHLRCSVAQFAKGFVLAEGPVSAYFVGSRPFFWQ